MKTRQEHIADLNDKRNLGGYLSAVKAIDYAIAEGLEVKPEAVGPVVGEVLTKQTRLMNRLAVVSGIGLVWQYDEFDDLFHCRASDMQPGWLYGCRIVYVPETPETPEAYHNQWTKALTVYDREYYCAGCSCGWTGYLYSSSQLAEADKGEHRDEKH